METTDGRTWFIRNLMPQDGVLPIAQGFKKVAK